MKATCVRPRDLMIHIERLEPEVYRMTQTEVWDDSENMARVYAVLAGAESRCSDTDGWTVTMDVEHRSVTVVMSGPASRIGTVLAGGFIAVWEGFRDLTFRDALVMIAAGRGGR